MLTKVSAPPYTIRGTSLGGVYTALHIPEIKTALDVGTAYRSVAGVDYLFVSHGHMDHLGALAALIGIRGLLNKPKLKVFMPSVLVEPVTEMLRVLGAVQGYDLSIVAIAMEPGDRVSLHGDLRVEAFRTYHRVPSLGYQFNRVVRKLRPAYRHLAGNDIAARRARGENLFETRERPEIAYATDTLPKVLERRPELLRSRVLILECTFLDKRKSHSAARAGGHIHLDDLLPLADEFENQHLVLMHFSQLYKPKEVVEILRRRCPPQLFAKIVPFVPEAGHWPG